MAEKKPTRKTDYRSETKKPAKRYRWVGLAGDCEVQLPSPDFKGFASKKEAQDWMAIRSYPYETELRKV